VNSNGQSKGDGNVAVFAVGETDPDLPGELLDGGQYTGVGAGRHKRGAFFTCWTHSLRRTGTVTEWVTDLNGDITVFTIDSSTGRLQLVPTSRSRTRRGSS